MKPLPARVRACRTRHRLSATLALAALGGATGAQADEPATADALPSVVVSAEKRNEPAERVPAALTVIRGEELRRSGIQSAYDLGAAVPNLQADRANGLQLTIRGVTSPDATEKGDPSAAFHLDGVYLARPQSLAGGFYDLERIEVLRGPQGTLWGRNATAGVINLVTAKPKPVFEARGALGVGDHASRLLDGMVNLPLNDQLALRVAVLRRLRDTELHSSAPSLWGPGGDTAETAARVHLLIKPQASWQLLLSADQSTERGAVASRVPVAQFFDLTNPLNPQPVNRGPDAQTDVGVPALLAPRQMLRHQGTRAELTATVAALGDAQFTWLAAHRAFERDADSTQPVFVGGSFVPLRARWPAQYSQTSHEWRLASPTESPSPWSWLVGLYAFEESSHGLTLTYNVPNPLGGTPPVVPVYGFDILRNRSRSQAAFGEVSHRFTPDTRATLGLRHTRDDKSRLGYTLAQATETYNPGTDLRLLNDASLKGQRTNWRLGLDHRVDARTLAWASLATGYKSGSFNDGCEATQPGCVPMLPGGAPVVPAGLLYYRPETVQSLEAGLKQRDALRRLQWQASVFTLRYRDLQLNTIVAGTQFTRNAAQATSRGLEAEGRWGASAADWFTGSLAWLDAKYTEFNPVPGVSWAGRQLDRAPRTRVVAGYERIERLPQGGRIEAGASVMRSTAYVISDPAVPVQFTQPAFHRVDARAAYVAAGDAWRVSAWGRNLTNRITLTDYMALGNVAVSDGRRWGLEVAARF